MWASDPISKHNSGHFSPSVTPSLSSNRPQLLFCSVVATNKDNWKSSSNMVYEHDPSISEYQHEKHRPREKEALHILRKIASLVKPIMRQRGWRVGILTEFYPTETNLLGLNWNQGQKICLRLRYPGDANQFLPLEQVTDTMLHE